MSNPKTILFKHVIFINLRGRSLQTISQPNHYLRILNVFEQFVSKKNIKNVYERLNNYKVYVDATIIYNTLIPIYRVITHTCFVQM